QVRQAGARAGVEGRERGISADGDAVVLRRQLAAAANRRWPLGERVVEGDGARRAGGGVVAAGQADVDVHTPDEEADLQFLGLSRLRVDAPAHEVPHELRAVRVEAEGRDRRGLAAERGPETVGEADGGV